MSRPMTDVQRMITSIKANKVRNGATQDEANQYAVKYVEDMLTQLYETTPAVQAQVERRLHHLKRLAS